EVNFHIGLASDGSAERSIERIERWRLFDRLCNLPSPVGFSPHAAHVELDHFTGRDLPDFDEWRVRCGKDSELKIFSQPLLVEVDREVSVGDQSGNLCRKNDFVLVPCI